MSESSNSNQNLAAPEAKARVPKHVRAKNRVHLLRTNSRSPNRNSTSTLLVGKSTVANPDMDELLSCVATSLSNCILKGKQVPAPILLDIFDERTHPLTDIDLDYENPPSKNEMKFFITTIFHNEELQPECAIMMLAYIDRIIENTNLTLHSSNWRRVILSTLILATKVWEEQEVWNVDFLSLFPNVTTKDLAQMEKNVLNFLQYNVSLKASHYAKYYFELRQLAENPLPSEPLDRETARKLEKLSKEKEAQLLEEGGSTPRKRASSFNFGSTPSPSPMILP